MDRHPQDRPRFDRDVGKTSDRDQRDLLERAGDEVRSWFGDEQAANRRRVDERAHETNPERGALRGGNRDEWRDRDRGPSRETLPNRDETRPGRDRFDAREGWRDRDEPRAHDLMTRNVSTVHPGDTVERAARLMREEDCGALPVVHDNGRLIGMITDRDIVVRLVARGEDAGRARVEDAMTDEAHACNMYDDLDTCLRMMARHKVRRLPVVDDRNRVLGIISQSDIARYAGKHPGRGQKREVAELLYEVSEPTRNARR